jgi:dCMP deaminase
MDNSEFLKIMDLLSDMKYRPTWDEYFMMSAIQISKRSSCPRLHVGCIIVNDNRILATGYNGHIPKAPHTSILVDGHEQMTIHAEANAIADSASRGVKIAGSTCYITHYPCINCTKMLIAAGIKKIIYRDEYKPNDICKILFNQAKIEITKFT